VKSLVRSTNTIFPSKPIKDIFNKNLNDGVSVFTYRGYLVRIAHNKNEYLRLSCSSEDMLVELIPLGNQVMESNIIASYLMDSDDYSELMPTAEWNSNPDRRRRELSDGVNLGFRCVNLRLYDDLDHVNSDRSNVKKLKMGLF